MYHHKFSLHDIEEMMPWERDVYVILLNNYVREENERIMQQDMQRRANGR